MPRYLVSLRMEQTKEIRVWARDEADAEERAFEIVLGWEGVLSAEAEAVEEIEE